MEDFRPIFDAEAISVLGTVMGKLAIGALLGAIIGYERELHGRPAGIRTHMLLVLGVVLFSEVSKSFGGVDGSRIAAQIVTGVGFLGAGTILRMGMEIKGLTSAASLWSAAAIGMAVSTGGGFILVAATATALTLVTLAYVSKIERKLVPYSHPLTMLVEMDDPGRMGSMLEALQQAGGKIKGIRIVTSDPLQVQVEMMGDQDKCMHAIARTPGVQASSWLE